LEEASRYFLETCEALEYLHHLPRKVIHRDIKPENILLDKDGHVKLGDFGWANHYKGQKRQTFCGTLDYLPPEMIMGTGHDESADMWNMGVLLYEMTTGKSPFGSSSKDTTCRMILAVNLKFPGDLDADACELIGSLCKRKPGERLNVAAAMSHQFIMKFRGVTADTILLPADADEVDLHRPSVAVQKLRVEQTMLKSEMEQLVTAKKGTEDKKLEVEHEFKETCAKIKVEKQTRAQLEVACADLEKAASGRERELEEQRKKLQSLQAELAKMSNKGRRASAPAVWFSARRASKTALSGS